MTQDEREDFEAAWFFMTKDEQVEYLDDCRKAGEPPPAGTSARDSFDRRDAFARAFFAPRSP